MSTFNKSLSPVTIKIILTIRQLGQNGFIRLQSITDALRVLCHHTELVLCAWLQVTYLGGKQAK